MYSLGIDIGSSSVKVSIFDMESGNALASANYPETEMQMIAHKNGWAEQEPEMWWQAFQQAYFKACFENNIDTLQIQTIGISYQMHGLVCLDKALKPLRPSIIWCDSRAVDIGDRALKELGSDFAFNHLLNSPGNFTASKLKWVKDNEPFIYENIYKICLPGDYIALKLTDELTTTISGLSEGIFYDFQSRTISKNLCDLYGFDLSIFPEIKSSFDDHGRVSKSIVEALKISPNATVNYKAGDQPNNALSLNVLREGEIAATAGTSGVVYGVSDDLFIDPTQKVNSFAHVNYETNYPKIGILLCINGTGSANSWLQKITNAKSYQSMNDFAGNVKAGSDDLFVFPFGNGAERMLGNKNIGAKIEGINFNIHSHAHFYRAFQEGIAYSFMYGLETFKEHNIHPKVIRAGKANMFLSSIFSGVLATLANIPIELYNTDGSIGAARGALIGKKMVSLEDAFTSLQRVETIEPNIALNQVYNDLFNIWKEKLISFSV